MGTLNRTFWSLTASLMHHVSGRTTSDESAPARDGTAHGAEPRYYPVGNCFADYSQPTREEIDATDPDVEKLFAESREIPENK